MHAWACAKFLTRKLNKLSFMLRIGVLGPTFPPIEVIADVARRVEEKGYDSIWFPDHLMGWFPQMHACKKPKI